LSAPAASALTALVLASAATTETTARSTTTASVRDCPAKGKVFGGGTALAAAGAGGGTSLRLTRWWRFRGGDIGDPEATHRWSKSCSLARLTLRSDLCPAFAPSNEWLRSGAPRRRPPLGIRSGRSSTMTRSVRSAATTGSPLRGGRKTGGTPTDALPFAQVPAPGSACVGAGADQTQPTRNASVCRWFERLQRRDSNPRPPA
jgi:hypothetical protein